MRNIIVATLFTSVAMTGASFAQTATPGAGTADPAMQTEGTADPAMQTEGAAPAAGETAMGGDMAMANEGGFITYQEGTQLLGSGLMGADVRGPDGESIGTVDDLLLDTDGQIQAVVVGVGGFLGIGQKDVAIANDQLEFVLAQDAAAADTAAGGTAMAPAETTGAATTPAAPAETGTMGATGAAGTAPATGTMAPADTAANDSGWGWSGAGIDHITVAYTREQLEAAPEFESAE